MKNIIQQENERTRKPNEQKGKEESEQIINHNWKYNKKPGVSKSPSKREIQSATK